MHALPVTAVAAAAAVLPLAHALVSSDGTGRLPALGWNSWNEYACDISEDLFLEVAQKLADLGLKDAGYEYVNIDDCWSSLEQPRDNKTGRLNPDPVKFPSGISGLVSKVHALGLKLGIYSDAGTLTCGKYAGSLLHEELDAATFADWGIDYLKYDNCYVPDEWADEYEYRPEYDGLDDDAPEGYDWSASRSAERFHRMRDALLNQTHTIQYSMCIWGSAHVEEWGNSTGHSWRMWADIRAEWASVAEILNHASFLAQTTDFWSHGDWDMLEVGNGDLTYEESRTHFALFAALKSPLIIGTRLHDIKPEILAILLNKELLAFNQDPVYGAAAVPYKWGLNPDNTYNKSHPAEFWAGRSVRGTHVFVLNSLNATVNKTIDFGEVPGLGSGAYLVHDMWTGEDIGVYASNFTAEFKAHDNVALRLTPATSTEPQAITLESDTAAQMVEKHGRRAAL
jgi:alpha-galactosidase